MELVLNGKPTQVPDGITIAGLLKHLCVQPERVAVEVNLTVMKRAQHPTTVLNAGDQVEVIHIVGGGGWSCRPQILDIRGQTSDFRRQAVVCSLRSVV